jgi:hypothetical protein
MAPVHWVFDFTSLMILIGEPHESKFRSCRDTLLEVLVAAPVAGIQSYLKSYEALPDSSAILYLSPYGVKRAPLRNMRLHYFISYWELLRNGKYTTYNIPDGEPNEGAYKSLSAIWLIFTWLYFGGVVAFWRLVPFGVLPKGTWIGIANVATFTGWSIILRVIEFVMMKEHEAEEEKTRDLVPKSTSEKDGIIFLGKNNSGLVFTGSRTKIKYWTSTNRLDYREGRTMGFGNEHYQRLTLIGTILVLVLIFLTLPNGSTTDQIAFILLNLLGQFNLHLGLRLNALLCKRSFERTIQLQASVPTRTHVLGLLIRYFSGKEGVDSKWFDKVDLLPKTSIWDTWKVDVAVDRKSDPKELWEKIKNSK